MKYFRPETLDNLFGYLLDIEEEKYTFLSGGTDLVPQFEQSQTLPVHLIDVKKIKELKGIVERGNEIEIGALTTIEEIKKSRVIQNHLQALWMSTIEFGGVQIRHRATIGGNICNASPAGDTLPPLYVLNAKLKIISQQSDRWVPVSEFILGPGKVDLNPGEILQSVNLSKCSYPSTFYKFGLRNAMAISVVNFAMVYHIHHRMFQKISIAAGAVAPTVVFLNSFCTTFLENKKSLDEVIEKVDMDIAPITDIRGTAKYRKQLLKNILRYVIKEIQNRNNTNQTNEYERIDV